MILVNPDCLNGAHKACSGDGWDETAEKLIPCPCDCHAHDHDQPQEHYEGCPCGQCQGIRANQPVATAMQAKHLSGASIGKLVQYSSGRSITTNEHLWSPTAKLTAVWHAEESVEVSVDYDLIHDFADTYDQIGLKPNDWVLVTQVAA